MKAGPRTLRAHVTSSSEPAFETTAAFELVIASFVVLAQELALIRWLPGQVRVLAYFSNIVLISAFLGLGIGCLLASRRLPRSLWQGALLVLVVSAALMSRVAFTQESAQEHLWLLYFDLPKDAPIVHGIRLPIITLFILSASTFVWLGYFVAGRLRWFASRGRPLVGYACDLTGSLLGVVVFSAMSWAGVRPWLWFVLIIASGIALQRTDVRSLVIHLLAGAAVVAAVIGAERAQWYSPYYAISTRTRPGAVSILTNGSLHQIALPLRLAAPAKSPALEVTRAGYHLPYRLLRSKPQRILIFGAGTGNDVAVALDEDVPRVDAVEIDPLILDLGRRLHPEQPYSSPRVRIINTDARAFLNDNHETYDLLVFGTLDSMTRLSALSNVRLDNFVYTVESLRAAWRHVSPGGGIAMYFRVSEHAPYINQHIASMLGTATGERPIVINNDFLMFNRIYLCGPIFMNTIAGSRRLPEQERLRIAASRDIPTDDWPYLYLSRRAVTPFYASMMSILFAIATAAVFAISPEMRRSLRTGGFDAEMFLFGAAFLIIETKLVTEMNLVWGATWITSAVVFGSILLMILAGTIAMHMRPLPWHAAFAGLIAALVLTYAVRAEALVGRAFAPRLALSIGFIGLPVFFASICFAVVYRERDDAGVAFGWNMLGAVAGGILELTSMALGTKAMTLFAIVAYLAAYLVRYRRTALNPARATA